VWLTLSARTSGEATVSSDDVFVSFGVLPPGGSVTYHGRFTQVDQTVSIEAKYDFNAWLWNTADTILGLIPGGSALSQSALGETLNAIKGLNSVLKAANELKAIKTDGWLSIPGHVWAAATELRKIATEDTQAAALQAILARVGINVTQDLLKDLLVVQSIYDELKHIAHTLVFFIVAPDGASIIFEAKYYGAPPIPVPPPPPPRPTPIPTTDSATFLSDITLPDGSVVSPGQALVKTWRVRNSGTSTWGSGYQLAFVGGDRMGAPDSVNLPRSVAPGEEVDISVNMMAPSTGGSYQGNWQMRNAQGVYFGDRMWVRISVPSGPTPTPPPNDGTGDITVQNVEYPSVVTPGQRFRPRITVRVNQGQLLQSRGDMLRNSDGNLYGAWPHVAVVGTVNAGQTYTFEFYENNPITAPSGEGTYESKWRVWRDGNWAGPEITIRFDVRSGGGTRPNPPTLVSPGNWYVSRDGSTPTLCASAPGGLQYFFQIYESHDNHDSGWISSNCWTPPTLGPYGYQWHAKVRNPSNGLESDWSETWHFNIESREPTLDDVRFDPPSPSAAEQVRIYACARDEWEVFVNTATDGSRNGEWKLVEPPFNRGCDPNNPQAWVKWWTLPWEDGLHRIRIRVYKNGQNIVRDDWTYQLYHRKPDSVDLISPKGDIWLNSRTVTFRWKQTVNAQSYSLVVATDPDQQNKVLEQTLDGNQTSFTATFAEDYPSLYWFMGARNDVGFNGWSRAHFGLDRVPPSSAVISLPTVTTETQFVVLWNGSDDRSGIRWYDVQYRDSSRGEWTDWLVNTTSTAAIFSGQAGHTYYFRARALDNAGNLENWPAGDGDTYTKVDPTARPPTPWWNTAYGYKRNLLILNNDTNTLPVGYPVHLHFDNGTSPMASELYNASQSSIKGDDFRIIYNNQTELPRFVQTFQSDRIDIWFDLQAPISPNPGSDNNYQLYYGNALANHPPTTLYDVLPVPSCDSNTVALWSLTEGNGDVAGDVCGRHPGVVYNGQWVSGDFNQPALRFNPSSAAGDPIAPPITGTPDLSVLSLAAYPNPTWRRPGAGRRPQPGQRPHPERLLHRPLRQPPARRPRRLHGQHPLLGRQPH
jgi:hypothetical protein